MSAPPPDERFDLVIAQATAARDGGDLKAAQRLFSYALRINPQAYDLPLVIGTLQLRRRDPDARSTFLPLAEDRDLREGWFGLAAAAQQAGDQAEAASRLATGLSRHAPLQAASFHQLCRQVAERHGVPGWCALGADGTVTIGLSRPGSSARLLSIQIDGRTSHSAPRIGGAHDLIYVRTRLKGRRFLEVSLGHVPLLGSPIDIAAITRVEGFVEARDGEVSGWAWLPHDPDHRAAVVLSAADGRKIRLRVAAPAASRHADRTPQQRRFRLTPARIAGLAAPLTVRGTDGRHLLGSPLDPRPPSSTGRSFPAAFPRRPTGRALPVIDVVIPVYRGREETLACIEAVLATTPADTHVTVVEDASPDAGLVADLLALAASGRVRLIRCPENLGFPAAANAGLRQRGDRDVILLNSDTLVAGPWLERLQAAAHAAADIGTVTPFTNDGTLVSYPHPGGANPVPTGAALAVLNRLAQRANGSMTIDIPTAVGFCMYIRSACLDAVGLLREDVFAQGYGEENDFCLRATALGWRHVALPGVFVAHVGGRSFGAAKSHLMARNGAVLERLHPGYAASIAAFADADPLAPARRRLDLERWRAGQDGRRSVIIVTHGRGGGVQRHVRTRCAELRAAGLRPVVLSSRRQDGPPVCAVSEGDDAFPNLLFDLPTQTDALLALLSEGRPTSVELHHFIDHDPGLLRLGATLGLPVDIVVHDFVWFCPRVSLLGANHRYCAEPEVAVCESCVAELGTSLPDIGPTALRARSAALFQSARNVIVPSADTGRRLRRHFPAVAPETRAWEPLEVSPSLHRAAATEGPVRVCVAGAIGRHKGYETLLALGRDARTRGLALEYVLVGYSHDDLPLLQTRAIHVTGPFQEDECIDLVRAQQADCGFLPSGIPETWSFVLSDFWRAGLPVAAFDIGAQAERIRATGRGKLLPLALPVPRINDALIAWAMARRRDDMRTAPSPGAI